MNMTGPDGVEFDGMELKFEINFSNQSIGWENQREIKPSYK